MAQTDDKPHGFCAIFGDIVRSRSVENRAELQSGASLDEVATQLGVSQQAVTKLLIRLGYRAVDEGEAALRKCLAG